MFYRIDSAQKLLDVSVVGTSERCHILRIHYQVCAKDGRTIPTRTYGIRHAYRNAQSPSCDAAHGRGFPFSRRQSSVAPQHPRSFSIPAVHVHNCCRTVIPFTPNMRPFTNRDSTKGARGARENVPESVERVQCPLQAGADGDSGPRGRPHL